MSNFITKTLLANRNKSDLENISSYR